MGFRQLLKSNRQSLLMLIYLFAAPFFFDTLIISHIVKEQEHFFQQSSIEWLWFYVLTIPIMAFGFAHTTVIALISGYFLSWQAIPYVFISYLTASVIGYWSGNFISKGKFAKSIQDNPKAISLTQELKKKEFMIILMARLSPVLSFAVTNYLLSFVKARFSYYVIAGAVGMLPRTLLCIWIGSQAKSIAEAFLSPQGISIEKIATLLLLIISVVGFYYFISKALRNSAIKE